MGKLYSMVRVILGGIQLCTTNESSCLIIGNNVTFTGESHIVASEKISIGSDSIVSWNTQILDTDFHKIYVNGCVTNENEEIIIGNHVWIASGVTILKGSKIPDGCIVSAGSTINDRGGFYDNCLICGLPNKILKREIRWER